MQIDELRHCVSTFEMEKRLNSLPRGLDEAYAEVFERCPRPSDLIRFLEWIIFGQKEFTAQELAEVALVSCDNGDNALPFCDSRRRYGSPDDVVKTCRGLVIEVKGARTFRRKQLSVADQLIRLL